MNAKEVLTKWLDSVNSGDVAAATALYNEQAILLPTFSNHILNTPEKITDYFEKLASREGLDVSLHEKTVHVHDLTEKVSAISGIYRWKFSVDGEPLTFEARFSFVLDLGRESPIMQHHSSQIPRML